MTTVRNLESAPAAAAPEAPAPAAAPAPAPVIPAVAPPSVHVRAVITWIAIFPLVAVGLTVLAPFAEAWPPVVRALVLTLVVVPTAVYVVVPQLLRAHGRVVARRAARRA